MTKKERIEIGTRNERIYKIVKGIVVVEGNGVSSKDRTIIYFSHPKWEFCIDNGLQNSFWEGNKAFWRR